MTRPDQAANWFGFLWYSFERMFKGHQLNKTQASEQASQQTNKQHEINELKKPSTTSAHEQTKTHALEHGGEIQQRTSSATTAPSAPAPVPAAPRWRWRSSAHWRRPGCGRRWCLTAARLGRAAKWGWSPRNQFLGLHAFGAHVIMKRAAYGDVAMQNSAEKHHDLGDTHTYLYRTSTRLSMILFALHHSPRRLRAGLHYPIYRQNPPSREITTTFNTVLLLCGGMPVVSLGGSGW